MKKIKFFLDKQYPGSLANVIDVEYDDNTTDEEIEDDFVDWVFGQIDATILNKNQKEGYI